MIWPYKIIIVGSQIITNEVVNIFSSLIFHLLFALFYDFWEWSALWKIIQNGKNLMEKEEKKIIVNICAGYDLKTNYSIARFFGCFRNNFFVLILNSSIIAN